MFLVRTSIPSIVKMYVSAIQKETIHQLGQLFLNVRIYLCNISKSNTLNIHTYIFLIKVVLFRNATFSYL